MLRVPIYNRIWRDKLRQRISAIPIELLKWKFTSGSILPAGAPAKLAESLSLFYRRQPKSERMVLTRGSIFYFIQNILV